MASFTVNVPDESHQRVVDGFCAAMGYMEEVPNPEERPVPDPDQPDQELPAWEPTIPNPQSREDFVTWHLGQYLARTVTQHEQNAAVQAAAAAAAEAAVPLEIG